MVPWWSMMMGWMMPWVRMCSVSWGLWGFSARILSWRLFRLVRGVCWVGPQFCSSLRCRLVLRVSTIGVILVGGVLFVWYESAFDFG